MKTGPNLVYLTDRLIQCPQGFLEEPWFTTTKKGISTSALYNDLMFFISGEYATEKEIQHFQLKDSNENRNYLLICQIIIYFLFDSFFENKKEFKKPINDLLFKYILDYKKIIQARKFTTDPERREELARLVLYVLDMVPEGENEKYALGRLTTLDSIERDKLVKETRESQRKREEEIREAIRRKEAEEAASRMSGE